MVNDFDGILSDLGAAVRDRRTELGMSQEQLADLCHLHRTYVGDIERGKRNVGLINLGRLSRALDLPLWELLKRADDGSAK